LLSGQVIITLASFVLTAGVTLVVVTRALSKVELSLRAAIVASKDEVEEKIAELRREFEAKADRQSREFGETIRALKEHVHRIETWARDEFVRKASFEGAVSRIERSIERMEKKIDKIAEAD
jgi:exonuclease VII small subunit